MKLLQALTLFFCLGLVYSQEWEFGENRGVETTNVAGTISLLTHTVSIPLTVPVCYNTTYVHVKVENPLATPKVTYDKNFDTVVIHYSWYQPTSSSYQVLAKSERDIFCEIPPNGAKSASRYGRFF